MRGERGVLALRRLLTLDMADEPVARVVVAVALRGGVPPVWRGVRPGFEFVREEGLD